MCIYEGAMYVYDVWFVCSTCRSDKSRGVCVCVLHAHECVHGRMHVPLHVLAGLSRTSDNYLSYHHSASYCLETECLTEPDAH